MLNHLVRTRLTLVVGLALTAGCGRTPAGPAMEHTTGLVYFAPEEGADVCMKGLLDGLKAEGIQEGKNQSGEDLPRRKA